MIKISKNFIPGLLLCFCVCSPICAHNLQNLYSVGEKAQNLRAEPYFFQDLMYIASAPARVNKNSMVVVGGLSVVTVALMAGLDTPVYNSIQSQLYSDRSLMAAPGRFYNRFNTSLFAFGSSGLLIGTGYLLNDSRMARTGWTAIEAVVFTQLVTGLLKTTMGRKRPFVRDGNMDFDLLDLDDGNPQRSFPSGHTSKIFALSTVIASSYDSPWIRIPAYAMAGSVALQRIESSNHWVSDVVMGGAIGYFMGRALAKRNGLVQSSSRIYPVIQGGLVGLDIRF